MRKAPLGDRLRYRFDNFMARGTVALVGALFAVTSLVILVATLILVLARLRPEGSTESLSFAEAFWQVTMRTIDAGTVAGDTGWSFWLIGFAITLGGIFIIVSEILDVRNRDLAEVTSADDVIISERLVALALTQIAENKAVVPVFVEFLSPGGPAIYLKPAQDYIAPDRPVNFYTVVDAARRKGQTAIGCPLLAEASEPDRALGVHLNPDKSAPIILSGDDRIIVLAEE